MIRLPKPVILNEVRNELLNEKSSQYSGSLYLFK